MFGTTCVYAGTVVGTYTGSYVFNAPGLALQSGSSVCPVGPTLTGVWS